MGVARGLKQFAIFVFGQPGRKAVGRYPVGPLGKDGHAVNDEVEALARVVALLSEFQRAQAGAPACLID